MLTTRLRLPSANGPLEALWAPHPAPLAYALVCHPHPAFGGNMHNNTTYRIAQACAHAAASPLRFNFLAKEEKGALQEAHDALAFLKTQNPRRPLLACGFSFGARTALALALEEPLIQATLAVGVGVDFFDMRFASQLQIPAAFVHAENDEFGRLPHLKALIQQINAPTQLYVVPHASHLFSNHMQPLEAQLTSALTWLLTPLST